MPSASPGLLISPPQRNGERFPLANSRARLRHESRLADRSQPTLAWTLLDRLDSFLDAWRRDEEPSIDDYLPPPGAAGRRDALVQFLAADLEIRHRRGFPKCVEEYVAEFPELAEREGVPCELIFEEFHVRRGAGEDVDPQEYHHRFPDRWEALESWFALAGHTAAPTLFSGASRIVQVREGQTLDDFDLMAMLGEGSFARVFLARQNSMRRLVAVKVSADRGSEPQMLAQLDHSCIVRVYDQRRIPDRGIRLLYMQYVAGGTLRDVVERVRNTPPQERRGSLLFEAVDEAVERGGQPAMADSPERRHLSQASWPEMVCRLGMQLAEALDYAHGRGYLHRDVKPANVLLAADGTPKLADFNVSSDFRDEEAADAARVGGSLAYMSPEQLEAFHPKIDRSAGDVDPRSDVYALGVLLWELLHGRRPFQDEAREAGLDATIEDMIAARRAGPPPRESAPGDSLLLVLEDVLRRCLAPHPDDRFPTAARLARELRICLIPRAREILQAPPRPLMGLAQRNPMLAGMVVGHGSHAVAAIFLIAYIEAEIIHRLGETQQLIWAYQWIAAAIVGFGVGSWAVWWLGGDVARLSVGPLDESHDPEQMAKVRRQALNLGTNAPPIGLSNWCISGAWHVVFVWMLAGGLAVSDCLHILLAHVICGCIAVVYPVLAGVYVSIRAHYPALVARSPGEPQDGEELRRLANNVFLRWAIPFAGVIPMLAFVLYGLTGVQNNVGITFLGVTGIAGVFVAYHLSRTIQADLEALIRAAGESPHAAPPNR